MIFNVDFDKWILAMLPTFLRKRVIFAFCRAMCAPVVSLYGRFLNARSDHIFNAAYNGQVCYLRAALNDAFNTLSFEISDSDDMNGEWQYAKDNDPETAMPSQLHAVDEALNNDLGEDQVPEHPTPVLYDEVRMNAAKNEFIVYVPSIIYATQLDRVKAIVDHFRIPSKTPIYTSISNNEQRPISKLRSRQGWQWPLSFVNSRS